MRKFYSLFAFVAMMVISLSANAVDFTLPSENPILEGETYNMRLFKTWDFIGLTCNGEAITPTSFVLGAKDDNMPTCDGYKIDIVTNEGMEGWYVGIGNMVLNPGKGGIYNDKNGVRYMVYSGLKAGQIVVMQTKAGSKNRDCVDGKQYNDIIPNCCKIQKGSADGLAGDWVGSFLSNNGWTDVVEEITDEIHAIQNEGVEEGGESQADAYRYFKVIEDGAFYMAFSDYAALTGFQIWIDAAADESVSVPNYKIVGVNDDARNIELTKGESTLGSACHVTYGFMEEEGASNEDFEYDPEVGYFTVSASDDADGDGVVIVEAVTISETGGKSEPVQFKIDVNEIELNAPTLTLYGFDGEERIYNIGWTNNTLCGEEYVIKATGDDGDKYIDFEPNSGIGENFIVTKNATVTVSVNGYKDGVATVEAEKLGTSIKRKNAEKAAEGLHDWDFAHLSSRQQALIKQDPQLDNSIVEKCYKLVTEGEVTDTIFYTAEEYIEGVSKSGEDISDATPVLTPSGWYGFDSGKGRTSLKTVEGGGNDQNADGNGYADDAAKIWDGLQISNPPYINSKNELTSSILIYINDDLGLYLGTKPTFTFPRAAAAAGEYVLMYIGYGGSNYTNSRYPVIYEVPVGELQSVTLNNNPHVFYIDIYTYEGLPTDEYDDTAVSSVKSGIQPIVGYYSINGAKIAAPQKGINIVKYADGTTMKVLVK